MWQVILDMGNNSKLYSDLTAYLRDSQSKTPRFLKCNGALVA